MGNCLAPPSAAASATLQRPPPPPHVLSTSSSSGVSATAAATATAPPLQSLYIMGQEVGRGQSGVIRICTSRTTGLPFACKSIPKSSSAAASASHEARIMTHLLSSKPHPPPSLLRLHHVFEDDLHFHLVLDLCRGGDLFNLLSKKRRFTEPAAASILSDLLSTIAFCHRAGVMHRDLKPENILLASDSHSDISQIKLADFGLAVRFTPGEKFNEVVGSSYYMAPEMLRGEEYNESVDVWSVGVIGYVLLSGCPPFGGHTEQAIFNSIQKGNLTFRPPQLWSHISPSAIHFISSMLCPDPTARITISQALSM